MLFNDLLHLPLMSERNAGGEERDSLETAVILKFEYTPSFTENEKAFADVAASSRDFLFRPRRLIFALAATRPLPVERISSIRHLIHGPTVRSILALLANYLHRPVPCIDGEYYHPSPCGYSNGDAWQRGTGRNRAAIIRHKRWRKKPSSDTLPVGRIAEKKSSLTHNIPSMAPLACLEKQRELLALVRRQIGLAWASLR